MSKSRKRYDSETIEQARQLWVDGVAASAICEQLNINNVRVVYSWRDRYEWDTHDPVHLVQIALSRKSITLIDTDNKTPQQYQDLSFLNDELLKLEKAKTYQNGGSCGAGRPPRVKNGEAKRKRKKVIKNDISGITVEQLRELESKLFYKHQKIWLDAGRNPETRRQRFILKPRQVGATYTFAWEALCDAIESGTNQMFISATRAQAEVFKSYIFALAWEHLDIELSGNPTVLSNRAEFHYLSPNSNAQSRSGNVYFDECFWTGNFQKMRDLAQPMATLQGLKKTYFSTPSAVSHDAYEIWNGDHYTRHHADITIEVEDLTALHHGRLDPDGFWRCAIPLELACEWGWDEQVDYEELKRETPDPITFSNIYQCKFVDDSASVFKLKDILACAVDVTTWKDVDFNSPSPVGSAPCTSGYDPAGTGDNATFNILTRPRDASEKFRLINKNIWRGLSARVQAANIANASQNYNIEYLEVDATGGGLFVADFIDSREIREVNKVQYSPDYKTLLVQKGLSVITARRFEYDENDTTLPLAFMTIYQTVTPADAKITYKSRRSKKVGHGDEAWACLHAFMCEPLAVEKQRTVRARSL